MTKRRSRSLLRILVVLALVGAGLYFLIGSPRLQWASAPGSASEAKDELQAMLLGLKVRIALLEKMGLEAVDVRIDAEGSRVILRGEVESERAEQRAREIASSVEGVKEVKSEIRLKPAEGETGVKEKAVRTTRVVKRELADALLEARVKTNLLSEVGANALRIEVEARRGTVSLKGEVKSQEIETLALASAARTAGVESVVDLIAAEAQTSP